VLVEKAARAAVAKAAKAAEKAAVGGLSQSIIIGHL
jgi:hypothetical protein